MPNWCDNKVKIKGDLVRIQNLWSSLTVSGLVDLMDARPIPEEWESEAYDWCLENWGTKWPMDVSDVDKVHNEILIHGVTPWGPPLALLQFISQNWEVECTVFYSEPGMDFAGGAVFKRGEGWFTESSITEYMTPGLDDEDFDLWHDEWCDALERCLEFHESEIDACLILGII